MLAYQGPLVTGNVKVERVEGNFEIIECNFGGCGETKCPGTHDLTPFQTDHSEYYCDICKKKDQPKGTSMRRCRICDYDVCIDCFFQSLPRWTECTKQSFDLEYIRTQIGDEREATLRMDLAGKERGGYAKDEERTFRIFREWSDITGYGRSTEDNISEIRAQFLGSNGETLYDTSKELPVEIVTEFGRTKWRYRIVVTSFTAKAKPKDPDSYDITLTGKFLPGEFGSEPVPFPRSLLTDLIIQGKIVKKY